MATWRPAGEPTLTCKGYERVTSRVEQNGTEICRRCGFKLLHILLTVLPEAHVVRVRCGCWTVGITVLPGAPVVRVRCGCWTVVIECSESPLWLLDSGDRV